jgi:hypothetical protein
MVPLNSSSPTPTATTSSFSPGRKLGRRYCVLKLSANASALIIALDLLTVS